MLPTHEVQGQHWVLDEMHRMTENGSPLLFLTLPSRAENVAVVRHALAGLCDLSF